MSENNYFTQSNVEIRPQSGTKITIAMRTIGITSHKAAVAQCHVVVSALNQLSIASFSSVPRRTPAIIRESIAPIAESRSLISVPSEFVASVMSFGVK